MKPHFQSIVDKQQIANFRLNHDKTTRSDPEKSHYRRVLDAVPLTDLALPKLPTVRVIGSEQEYVLLGELAQQAGIALLLDLATHLVVSLSVQQLELCPPA